jgi:hypothetical protein
MSDITRFGLIALITENSLFTSAELMRIRKFSSPHSYFTKSKTLLDWHQRQLCARTW